jgi:hypothetical protein
MAVLEDEERRRKAAGAGESANVARIPAGAFELLREDRFTSRR